MKSRESRLCIANGILWAAAILTAAWVGCPPFYTTLLLPVLAIGSQMAIERTNCSCRTGCRG